MVSPGVITLSFLAFTATSIFGANELTQETQNLDYNVPGGKLNRGLSVVDTLRVLKGGELTEDEYFRAAVLGWCVELVRLWFFIAPFLCAYSP